MNFFGIIIGTIFGILIAVGIILLIIYLKLIKSVGKSNMSQMISALSNVRNSKEQEYSREKSIKGMTTLLEPEILKDFPDFNKELMFSNCESNIRKILNMLESKDISKINNDSGLILMKKSLIEKIIDMNSNNIFEKYDNIMFNRHAISAYTKKDGKATIQISTTLSYYYDTNKKNETVFSKLKKQTRFTSEFVYVYDESNFSDGEVSFSVHCPNCGAPLKKMNSCYCEYCSTYIGKINLKVWKMSSCKEDYK